MSGTITEVAFMQYKRPDGRAVQVAIARPPEQVRQGLNLWHAGCELAAEVLTTGEVSFTVERDDDGETQTLAHEVVENGPEVPAAVDRLLATATKALETYQR